MRLGGTAFDKLDLSLAVNNGRAEIQHGVMISHGVTAEIEWGHRSRRPELGFAVQCGADGRGGSKIARRRARDARC